MSTIWLTELLTPTVCTVLENSLGAMPAAFLVAVAPGEWRRSVPTSESERDGLDRYTAGPGEHLQIALDKNGPPRGSTLGGSTIALAVLSATASACMFGAGEAYASDHHLDIQLLGTKDIVWALSPDAKVGALRRSWAKRYAFMTSLTERASILHDLASCGGSRERAMLSQFLSSGALSVYAQIQQLMATKYRGTRLLSNGQADPTSPSPAHAVSRTPCALERTDAEVLSRDLRADAKQILAADIAVIRAPADLSAIHNTTTLRASAAVTALPDYGYHMTPVQPFEAEWSALRALAATFPTEPATRQEVSLSAAWTPVHLCKACNATHSRTYGYHMPCCGAHVPVALKQFTRIHNNGAPSETLWIATARVVVEFNRLTKAYAISPVAEEAERLLRSRLSSWDPSDPWPTSAEESQAYMCHRVSVPQS